MTKDSTHNHLIQAAPDWTKMQAATRNGFGQAAQHYFGRGTHTDSRETPLFWFPPVTRLTSPAGQLPSSTCTT